MLMGENRKNCLFLSQSMENLKLYNISKNQLPTSIMRDNIRLSSLAISLIAYSYSLKKVTKKSCQLGQVRLGSNADVPLFLFLQYIFQEHGDTIYAVTINCLNCPLEGFNPYQTACLDLPSLITLSCLHLAGTWPLAPTYLKKLTLQQASKSHQCKETSNK